MNALLNSIANTFDRLHQSPHRDRIYLLALLLLVLLGCGVLLYPGIPQGHDLLFHLERLRGMAEGVRAGIFPVRINPNALNSYGYATGLFYPDLFLYPAALLAAAGIPLVTSYKLFLVGWMLFNALSMFCVARRIAGKDAATGFIAGLLFAYSSYFAVDVFSRAALGEVLAFPFIPWTILGAYELIYGNARRFGALAFGLAGLLLTHNITLVLMLLVLGCWFAANIVRLLREPQRIGYTLLGGATALLLALFYLAPMFEQLAQMRFNLTGKTLVADLLSRAVPFPRLFLELPYARAAEWIPSGIGLMLLTAALCRFRIRSTPSPRNCGRDAMLLIGAGCLLGASNFLPWEGALRVLAPIQFPWRLYILATGFLALGGGLALGDYLNSGSLARRRSWMFILLCGCAFAYYVNVGYVYAAKIHEGKMLRHFVSAGDLAASGLHYLPQGVKLEQLEQRGDRVDAPAAMTATAARRPGGLLEVDFSGNRDGATLVLPLIGYAGYHAATRDRELEVLADPVTHLVAVRIPADCESGKLEVRYRGTPLQHLTLGISIVVLLGLLLWGLREKHREALRHE